MPFWLVPNLLSLDAPLVAVIWQSFLAQTFQLPLRPAGRAVLFLTVWAIYLADRLLDVRYPNDGPESARHEFYRRHRRLAVILLAAATAAALLVTLFWLRPAVFHNGMFIFAGVVLYFFLAHSRSRRGLPKEVAIAVLFTVGTFLVPWTIAPDPRLTLAWPAALFFALCLANLTAIENWEWNELRGAKSLAPNAITIWLGRRWPYWLPAAMAACVWGAPGPVMDAGVLSAAAMAGLRLAGTRVSLELRRVLVDAALLSPLVWMV